MALLQFLARGFNLVYQLFHARLISLFQTLQALAQTVTINKQTLIDFIRQCFCAELHADLWENRIYFGNKSIAHLGHGDRMSATLQTDCINNLKHHVQVLAGKIGERHVRKQVALQQAANYISQQWQAMGYAVVRQPFYARGVVCENLEVSSTGKQNPDDIVLVCAHYDTAKECPGANDNASGIAAMLEISRYFAETRPHSTIRFVALTNEKPPFAGTEKSGSWLYAHQANQRYDKIRAAIILESLGYYNNAPGSQLYPPLLGMLYPRRANFVAMTSNLRSMGVMRRFAKCFNRHATLRSLPMIAPNFLPWVTWSDNSPFWLHGYRAFMVSDTSLYRYPFYNSIRDTPEKLDYESLAYISIALMKAIEECLDQK